MTTGGCVLVHMSDHRLGITSSMLQEMLLLHSLSAEAYDERLERISRTEVKR